MAVLARFESKVDRSGVHHRWQGGKTVRGLDGKPTQPQRLAWELGHGTSPDGRVRRCTEADCVRLDHLSASTSVPDRQTVHAAPLVPEPIRQRARRGGGTKKETESGVWKLVVPAGVDGAGKRLRSSRTFRGSSPEATVALAQLVTEQHAGLVASPGKGTVAELWDLYMLEKQRLGRAETTIAGYTNAWNVWLKHPLGHRRASAVTSDQIEQVLDLMAEKGRSAASINQTKVVIKGMYDLGRRKKLVNRSPVTDVVQPASTQPPAEKRVPELAEAIAFLTEIEERAPTVVANAMKFASLSGCRRGEVCGFRRNRINWSTGEITINGVITDTGRRGGQRYRATPKTGKARTFPLATEGMAFLSEVLAAQDAAAKEAGLRVAADAFVFTVSPNGEDWMRPGYLTDSVVTIRDQLVAQTRLEGIGGAPLAAFNFDATVQSMRRFTTTQLLESGIALHVVAARQGHSTQTILNYYAGVRKAEAHAAAEALEAVLLPSGDAARADAWMRAFTANVATAPLLSEQQWATVSATVNAAATGSPRKVALRLVPTGDVVEVLPGAALPG